MNSEKSAPGQVFGERGATVVNRAISVQSRLSSILAVTEAGEWHLAPVGRMWRHSLSMRYPPRG